MTADLTAEQFAVHQAIVAFGQATHPDDIRLRAQAVIDRLAAARPSDDLTGAAWGIIANAGGGDWTKETPEWQEAAAAWRERYHAALAAEGSGE